MMRLEKIYNIEDKRTQLHDKINGLEIQKNYLQLLVGYFKDSNITKYNKFDKRDMNKIKDYLAKCGFECYYSHCQDNVNIHFEKDRSTDDCDIYLVINNKRQYDIDIKVYRTSWVDNEKRFEDVQEQAINRLEYVSNRLDKLHELQANFDSTIKTYNDKVSELYNVVYNTGLKEIMDIYIYAD